MSTTHSRVLRISIGAPTSYINESALFNSGRGHGRGLGRGHGRDSMGGRGASRSNRKCEHYGRTNHVSKKCWDKLSKPESKKVTITQEEYDRLVQSSTTSTTTHANSLGIPALFTSSGGDWIADSSASKRISSSKQLFSSLSSSASITPVTVANGARSTISSQAVVSLLDNLTLRDVLYVLNFPVNLLFVNEITKKLQCTLTFFLSYVLFQNLQTKRWIGSVLKGETCIVSRARLYN